MLRFLKRAGLEFAWLAGQFAFFFDDSANGNWTYTYDDFNRLIGANQNSGHAVYSYAYDRFGNRWQQNGPHTILLTFSGANNRMDGYSYDADGNVLNDGVHSYAYDAENRIISVDGGATTYVYDAFGRRVSKTVGGTTQYLYDGVNPVEELPGTTVTATTLTGLAVDEYFQRTDASGPSDYLTDALGSTVALTGATGNTLASYTYEPFDNTTLASGSSSNPYQFTGGTSLTAARAEGMPAWGRAGSPRRPGWARRRSAATACIRTATGHFHKHTRPKAKRTAPLNSSRSN